MTEHCDPRFALARQTAPCHPDKSHGSAMRGGHAANLGSSGAEAAIAAHPSRTTLASENRRWLNEMITDSTANAESIAAQDGCSVRQVNMTISLAFLAPKRAAIDADQTLDHRSGCPRCR
jgi:hypothetical protein